MWNFFRNNNGYGCRCCGNCRNHEKCCCGEYGNCGCQERGCCGNCRNHEKCCCGEYGNCGCQERGCCDECDNRKCPESVCGCKHCIICSTGATGPCLESYIEAVGGTQNVASKGNVMFDVSPAELDVVGTDITLDSDGRTFRFHRTGLYRVEWSLSVSSSTAPVIVCLLENGDPSSPMKLESTSGNMSSGALIHVTALPYTLTLNNFQNAITLADPAGYQNTVASIRISRFADAPFM